MSISIVVCEKVLKEQDNVTSAVRIVDTFYVDKVPSEGESILINAATLVIIKSDASFKVDHHVLLKLIGPDDRASEKGPYPFLASQSAGQSGFSGLTITGELQLQVNKLGVFYVVVEVDGIAVSKSPLNVTLRPSASSSPQ